MIKKEGKIPCNARVDVDYSGKKPKIKFGYTSKKPSKDAYKQCFLGIHLVIFSILFLVIPYIAVTTYTYDVEYPEHCSLIVDQGYTNVSLIMEGYDNYQRLNLTINRFEKFIKGVDFICDSGNYSVSFSNEIYFGESPGFDNDEYLRGMKSLLTYLGVLLVGILLTYLSTRYTTKWLIKQKWYQKWLPKHMAGGVNRSKKYYKFKPRDVLDGVVVIPRFDNVELEYKTKGDFSKYLKGIKIREYKWNRYKKQKAGKLNVEVYKWYAVFYFSETPKTGYMEVIYQ